MGRIILLTIGFLLTLPLSVQATEQINNKPANADVGIDVQRAQNYLRGLTTIQANFIQRAHNGSNLTGTFYLKRPGRLRFEYNETDDFVVADGIFIYFYDSELKEQSNAPIGQTLADFLLRKNLSLTDDLRVKDVQKQANHKVITLAQKGDEGAGQVKLFFTQTPYVLQKWQVIDAAGLTTEIILNNIQRDVNLPASLFAYIAPKQDKPNYNE